MIPVEAAETARTQAVEEFLCADFIIPSHGGSMATGFMGTVADAQRIIDKFTTTRSKQ